MTKFTPFIFAFCCLFAGATSEAQPSCDHQLRTALGAAVGDARLVEALGRIQLGPFDVSQIPPGAIKVEGIQYVGADIFFTFTISINAISSNSRPTFSMAGPQVGGAVIDGRVRRLEVKGCMTIPGRTGSPRIEVPASQFFAEILTPSAALPSGLAGTVRLSGHFVELRNQTRLHLSLQGQPSSGVFDLTASNATTDAVEILAEGSKRSLLLRAAFQIPGQSRWSFDLQNPKIQWRSGKLRASPVSLTADEEYTMPLPKLDLRFKELRIAEVEVSKSATSSRAVSIALKNLALDAGAFELLGTPSMKGTLTSPFTTSGRLNASLTEDGQINVEDYELSDVSINLRVAQYADGAGVQLSESTISLRLHMLTASDLKGSVTVDGGRLNFSGGGMSGESRIRRLHLAVAGKRDALDGIGSIDIEKFSLNGTSRVAPIDKCANTTLDVQIKGGEANNVVGDVRLVGGKTTGSVAISRFKSAAGLSSFRCEWDQKVGALNRVEMNGIPYPCGSWTEPFKFCQDRWVLWEGGDVSVRWVFVAEPTITDVGVEIADLRYDLEKARVCDGKIHGLTLGLYRVSVTPNLPSSGTVFDVFRDAIQTLQGTWQTLVVSTLGPVLGALRVVTLNCA